jgi:hypothetical protein
MMKQSTCKRKIIVAIKQKYSIYFKSPVEFIGPPTPDSALKHVPSNPRYDFVGLDLLSVFACNVASRLSSRFDISSTIDKVQSHLLLIT